ncbi:MAG: DNA repair protein RadA [Deltaproteobacteria bacterium]|nr:DNA repair protein RadA [Deltaproteobacteria bacterium]
MKQQRARYVCQSCGYQSAKWLGRCPECGEWNSMVEELVTPVSKLDLPESPPIPIDAIETRDLPRLKTGLSELDRVLGGGIVPGSAILIGGAPGIGKSTLMMQTLSYLSGQKVPTLYVSGEESAEQIKLRANRLGISSPFLYILTENALEAILRGIEKARPKVVVVDSIQTLYTGEIPSAPGSVSQVRETAGRLVHLAKRENLAIFIIGHLTKEGAIAGPRLLEHIVDTVLYFEGEKGHNHRILRAIKNRFGSTNEIGVFEMQERGLAEVSNPSQVFLAERPTNVPGSVVISTLEGTRPILVELQALVTPSSLALPRRTSIGIDPYRLALLVAILEKRVGLNLGHQDIFFNVAGGIRVDEPGADLGIIVAIASSLLNKAVPFKCILLGEVGLTGEVRSINQPEIRLIEAKKMGFDKAILPKNNIRHIKYKDLEIIGVKVIKEAFQYLF